MLASHRANAAIGRWLQSTADPARFVCSDSLYEMLGYTRGGIDLGDALLGRLVHPDDLFRVTVFRDAIARTRFGEHALDCRIRRANGSWLNVRISSLATHAHGSPVISGTVELLDDPTPDCASIGKEAVRHAANSIRSPLFVFAADGTLIFANSAATNIAAPDDDSTDAPSRIDHSIAQKILRAVPRPDDEKPDAPIEITFRGRVWLCHATTLTDENARLSGTAVFCHDITKMQQNADQRVAAEQELTRALVKEVHHRIKNNLQATVGLLRQHTLEHDDSVTILDKGISQLLSIAAVHGIQSRVHEDKIYLCSVVAEVACAARSTSALRIEAPEALRLFALDEHYAVQIALIVNELITNATKYTSAHPDGRISIEIGHDNAGGARLVVTNTPARLPDDFDLASGFGLGAGLRLVRSLLPRGLSSLTIEANDAAVSASLRIDAPIITRCDNLATPRALAHPSDSADRNSPH